MLETIKGSVHIVMKSPPVIYLTREKALPPVNFISSGCFQSVKVAELHPNYNLLALGGCELGSGAEG